ncbi:MULTISPECIES: DUF3617 domain-containing protein [unclassified Duganella]|uniref:DUF3617 domain-containing protein n=1 Tax=unclassified Duganella TaxID=2636909 RepID=UPI0008748EFD|nr:MULTISPECIES: DUF3617 domain-containing protein [unclassified Duganella]OEZ54315.1 hypothetical protein DUGA6_58190 [Duganella sp. HH105]OEZ98183.1 hypothetical protein DUGA2_57530 [Duganella sp. HH101]
MKRLIVSLAMLAAVQASAQTIKPGLWELSNKVKTGNAQTDQAMGMALKQLANMPPEQRAQIEAMMKQNGASLPKAGADGGMVITACVTPEMVAKKELPMNQKGKCTSKSEPVAGGMNISFSCTEPASSGTGTLRFNGDSSYVMNMNVSSEAGGKPQNVQVESTGRWLGASCPAKPN